jgi:hypothetical protein
MKKKTINPFLLYGTIKKCQQITEKWRSTVSYQRGSSVAVVVRPPVLQWYGVLYVDIKFSSVEPDNGITVTAACADAAPC